MKILICNVGSTSLKFKLFDEDAEVVSAKIERIGEPGKSAYSFSGQRTGQKTSQSGLDVSGYKEGIQLFLSDLVSPRGGISSIDEIDVIGFKTVLAIGYWGVHELTEEVLQQMQSRLDIAPLHNACYLDAIRMFKNILPSKKLIGAFESDFHQTVPLYARLYGVPYSWYQRDSVQRIGYHGASHAYIAHRMSEISEKYRRVISCHLGGSSSICAILDGKSIGISSGFSPQTGLSHSNRVGDLDVYALFYELNLGKSIERIRHELDHESGLLGISGVSPDLRDIEEAARDGNERAQLAIDVFCHEIIKYIGSYYAILGGLDCLVFTGGIGENSALIREKACSSIAHFGICIDAALNAQGEKERRISVKESATGVWVVPTNEELQVARRIRSAFRI